MDARSAGFLIVRAPEGGVPYQGVDRVPAYPGEDDEETAALDAYVFDDYKDSRTNLIPTIDVATELLVSLSRTGRRYEVILCCSGPESEALRDLSAGAVAPLGFDVAVLQGDYWSIVGDFSRSAWARRFRERLNPYGLFANANDAGRYLYEYKHRNEPDSDMSLEVVYLARVDLA